MKELDAEERALQRLLKKGCRSNPISVKELSACINQGNAKVRGIISNMRDKGVRVCSDYFGYWIARNDKDYIEFRKAYLSKAVKRMNRVKAMDGECAGQLGFGEVLDG